MDGLKSNVSGKSRRRTQGPKPRAKKSVHIRPVGHSLTWARRGDEYRVDKDPSTEMLNASTDGKRENAFPREIKSKEKTRHRQSEKKEELRDFPRKVQQHLRILRYFRKGEKLGEALLTRQKGKPSATPRKKKNGHQNPQHAES